MSGPTGSTPSRAPRRVAILGCKGLPARYGGFETFADEVSRRWVARGLEVSVFCEGSDRPKPTELAGVRLVHVRRRWKGPLGTLTYDLASLVRARRGFDVVLLLGYGASFAAFLPRRGGAEVWIHMDGLEWRRSKWGRVARAWLWLMEGLARRTADRLVFDSRALLEQYRQRRRVGKGAPQLSYLAYGAPLVHDPDPAPLAELGLEPGAYDLAICRCEPENHLIEIVRAHRRAVRARPLLVVTHARASSRYARRLLALQSERVHFPGPIYDRRLLDPLRAHCHAYLHGHSVGGTNPSLLEAMGAGAAVVAHDNPFNREVLESCGLYFSGEEDLENALRRLDALTPEARRDLGRRARERVARAYAWDDCAAAYAALLDPGAGRTAAAA